jgi:hypothetical protein
MGQVFSICSGGLKPIGQEPIRIHAGGMYHYGASSSPDPVLVESTTGDGYEDSVTFYRYPYSDKCRQRERLCIFRNLAHSGTTTKLRDIERLLKSYGRIDWAEKLVRHYTAVLNNHEGLTWDRADIRVVKVEVAYRGDGDAWSIFERDYPHSVSGSTQRQDGATILESYDFNASDAAELCHRININKMPGFEYLGSTERD